MKKNRKAVSKKRNDERKMEKTNHARKGLHRTVSEWMAERLEAPIEYMQYGHAAVALYETGRNIQTGGKEHWWDTKKISESSMIRWK